MLEQDILHATHHDDQLGPSTGPLATWLDGLPLPTIVALDASGSRFAANRAAREAFGLAAGELRSNELPIARFRHFNDRLTTKAEALPLATAIAENRPIGPIEVTLLCSDGKQIPTRVVTSPLGGDGAPPGGAIAVFLDVGGRSDRASTDVRTVAEAIPHFVWICNPDGRLIYCNQRLLQYCGYTLPEMLRAASLTRILVAEDGDRLRRSWSQTIRSGSRAFNIECRILDAEGTPRWFLLRARAFRSGSGAVTHWFGTATDIEEQKLAEHAARRSEASFRTLTETIPQFICRIESDGTRTFVNHAFADYSGTTNDERGFTACIHQHDRERVTLLWDVWRETAEPIDVEVRLRGRDGSYRWFLFRRRPVLDTDGSICEWVGSITDINSAKLSAIGSRLLADVTGHFDNNRRLDESLQRVAASCASAFDAACIIELFAGGKATRVAFAHPDAVLEQRHRRVVLTETPLYPVEHPVATAMRTGSIQTFDGRAEETIPGCPFPSGSGIAVPLCISDRTAIGVMMLFDLDHAGTNFDEAQAQLALHVGRRLSERIASVQALDRDHKVAIEFQRAALPLELPEIPGLGVTVSYTAGRDEATIGGDWYDLFRIPDGRVAITIGDVTGSGTRAAVIMAQLRHTIRALMHADADPRSVATHTDAVLRSEYREAFATAFIGVFSPQTRELQYVVCGHPAPFLRTASGRVDELDVRPNPPIGLLDFVSELTGGSIRIESGSQLVCYTDGLIEAEREPLEAIRTLRSVLSDRKIAEDPAAIVHAVLHGDAPSDDAVVMTLRFS